MGKRGEKGVAVDGGRKGENGEEETTKKVQEGEGEGEEEEKGGAVHDNEEGRDGFCQFRV